MQRISTEQLFHTGPLLEKRLGKEAFESIPTSPGIYRFYDVNGDLLYVGKAKNLRRRLFGYKRAKPGKVSRKVSTLIGKIRSVIWVETATEHDALLLENRMIRGLALRLIMPKKRLKRTTIYILNRTVNTWLSGCR